MNKIFYFIKSILKKIVPYQIFSLYHFLLAILASLYFQFPSKKMAIIGVTGTKGKSSTCNFIWSVLQINGWKTGMISTANIRIGEEEILNKFHMTMMGRFSLQKILSQMYKNGCQFCIIETTAEGIKQWRHIGIFYDIIVLTNLFPEHLNSFGGSFEKYKQTKGKIFANLEKHKKIKKIIRGKEIKKTIIVNNDSEYKDYFLQFWTDKKITIGINNQSDFTARNIKTFFSGVEFNLDSEQFNLNVLASFNVYNALFGIAVGTILGIPLEIIKKGIQSLKLIPGRMEKIEQGQQFIVLVDYAHEKQSMTNVLIAGREMIDKSNKLILVLGAEGGGRDREKRFLMGEAAGKLADFVIITTVDPYDEDPEKIINDISGSVEKQNKIKNINLFNIADRKKAIYKALSLAQKGDLVLVTGKGAEQSIKIKEKQIPWDDRQVLREELKKILSL